jgi:hypothetical protein
MEIELQYCEGHHDFGSLGDLDIVCIVDSIYQQHNTKRDPTFLRLIEIDCLTFPVILEIYGSAFFLAKNIVELICSLK